jgi:hypothetical protein
MELLFVFLCEELVCFLSVVQYIHEHHFGIGGGGAVAQWLRRCATNRKFAGSIPDGVI